MSAASIDVTCKHLQRSVALTMKIMIVTGASRGIGSETALAAAEVGYSVCVNYHSDHDSASAVVEQIIRSGGRALAVQADVASDGEVVKLFQTVQDKLGTPSVVVNNAGILETGKIDTINPERLRRVFETNVYGPFYCAREAVRVMSTENGGVGGSIINISSVAAKLGAPGEYIDYAASKGAIDTMTVGLAKEVADLNIRVNAVRPGVIYTDIHARAGEPNRVDRVKLQVPMKRGGTAREVANAVIWLASDESAYCTGSFIDVSGGR